MSKSMILCSCGAWHPEGFLCPKMALLQPHTDSAMPEEKKSFFSVQGMDCPLEEKMIRDKLADLPGIHSLVCNILERTATVHHDPAIMPELLTAMHSLHLDAKLIDEETENSAPDTSVHWMKLLAAGIFASLSEIVEFMHDFVPLNMQLAAFLPKWNLGVISLFDHPFDLHYFASHIASFSCAEVFSLFCAIIAIMTCGIITYKKGWLALANKNLNINALMSVAVTCAFVIGQYPEAAMVMVLFNISESLESRALEHTRKAVKNLLALASEKASVLTQNAIWQEMDIKQITIGSRVRVRPGERIALDGIIISGHSAINQAPITGESMAVEKTTGDHVFAGTINESGSFEFTTTSAADNTTLARIIHSVEEAQNTRAPVQRFIDSFASYYTPCIFLLAFCTAIIPPLLLDHAWIQSIYMGLVILVTGCPCAFVIAVPVTIISGMAAATRSGILIKGGLFLEKGRLLKYLALDKTGTLTSGVPVQTDFIQIGNMNAMHAQCIAASLAVHSNHPVSKALAEYAHSHHITLQDVIDFEEISGHGICGFINGEKWTLGNSRMLPNLDTENTQFAEQKADLERHGKTVVMLISQNRVESLFAVADTVREQTPDAIQNLHNLGIKTVMLTGDNAATAHVIAEQACVADFRANLLPEDKLHVIASLAEQHNGLVGMAGDGINDAPALAKADIGFAMAGAGTDTAIETADVAIMDDNLHKIPRFIRLSRAVYAILVQNIVLALAIKIIFLTFAFLGMATMWMAVFADVGTSLLVVANGLRATRK